MRRRSSRRMRRGYKVDGDTIRIVSKRLDQSSDIVV